MNRLMGTLLLLLLAAMLASLSLFQVRAWETAMVVQVGKIVRSDLQPGLHVKWPLIEEAFILDNRIQTLVLADEAFLTAEKKNVIVDAYVQWRIKLPARYFTATRRGDEKLAASRLSEFIKDGLRAEFSRRTIQEVVSSDRSEIMEQMAASAAARAMEDMGVDVADVRVKRIDLPDEVSGSVYERMKSERSRVATEFRARGQAAARQIRADADLQHDTILAQSQRDGLSIRGEADAKASAAYATAYGSNPEFFNLYRSLNAYQDSIGQGDVLVLQPDSEFFRFFGNAAGKPR